MTGCSDLDDKLVVRLSAWSSYAISGPGAAGIPLLSSLFDKAGSAGSVLRNLNGRDRSFYSFHNLNLGCGFTREFVFVPD